MAISPDRSPSLRASEAIQMQVTDVALDRHGRQGGLAMTGSVSKRSRLMRVGMSAPGCPPVRLPNRDRGAIRGNAQFRHSVFPIPVQRVRAGPAIKERDFMRRFSPASFGLALAAAAFALATAPASAVPAHAPAAQAVSSVAVKASERCTIWRRRCRDLHPARGWGFRRCMVLHGCR